MERLLLLIFFCALSIVLTAQTFKIEMAEVEINSVPQGAFVYIADQLVGSTPVSFSYPAGRHRVTVKMDFYSEIEEVMELQAPSTKITFELKDERATLTVLTFKRADVYLNDEIVPNPENMKLFPQIVRARVIMRGAETLEKEIVLHQSDVKSIEMFPEFPAGGVDMDVTPRDALIELWEEGEAKYTVTGPTSFDKIPAGDYNLKVSKPGFKSFSGEIRIVDNVTEKRTVRLIRGADVGGEYVLLNGGTFGMGSSARYDEQPVRKVTLGPYHIGKYEVTQSEWNLLMDKNPSTFVNDSLPVHNVTWLDAVEFCNRLSRYARLIPCYIIEGDQVKINPSGNGYRLPTEAEWEFAALGGRNPSKYRYSGSDSLCVVGRYACGFSDSPIVVGSKRPNEKGIYDMSGNVAEWTWDWFFYYPEEEEVNPRGPDSGYLRSVRGGSWFDREHTCEVRYRSLYNPSESYDFLGFRVARSAY